MTLLQFVEYLLDNEWNEGTKDDADGVDGREWRVPKPPIDIEKDKQRISLSTDDHINVVDGGDTDYTPRGLGWTHEQVKGNVTIEIRTSAKPPEPADVDRPGRVRFNGWRDENNEAERYGGLAGEVKRILDKYRKGDAEFDIVEAAIWSDNSRLAGKNVYRGEWEVTLDERASEIDVSQ